MQSPISHITSKALLFCLYYEQHLDDMQTNFFSGSTDSSECQIQSRVLAPARTTREFCSPESTSVLTLTLASVQPCVMVVAHKISLSPCQKCSGRLQLNMHAPCVCSFAWSDAIWCMVVWCAQNVLKWQQFHMATSEQRLSTPLWWIFKMHF